MPINFESFGLLTNPRPEDIPDELIDFLRMLKAPTLIHLTGRDSSRYRAVITLLHGNEPSGSIAIHAYLKQGIQPAVNTLFAIISIQTALTEPVFSYRVLPRQRDMNRCFKPPFEGNQGNLARELISILKAKSPEAIVDIHNTSGSGPAFSLCTDELPLSRDVATLFTHRLIKTDIVLGALMEVRDIGCPVVTIECGGARDSHSHQVAKDGLYDFLAMPLLPGNGLKDEVDYYHHPVRLELKKEATLLYHDEPVAGYDVVLPRYVEHYNFGIIEPATAIGWLGPLGLEALEIVDAGGENIIDQYFTCCGNSLQPVQPLKLFMVTTNPQIAVDDCLFYAVKETDHQWLKPATVERFD